MGMSVISISCSRIRCNRRSRGPENSSSWTTNAESEVSGKAVTLPPRRRLKRVRRRHVHGRAIEQARRVEERGKEPRGKNQRKRLHKQPAEGRCQECVATRGGLHPQS